MKLVYIILLNTMLVLLLSSNNSLAQCSSEAQASACISQLQDGFTFLRSFKVDGKNGAKPRVEYSYVFSKDTQYYINICSDGPSTDGIIITMYDANRNMVTTNYKDGKFYPGLIYPCNASGIYYLTFTFRDSQNHCGGSVLGFRREGNQN